MLLLYPVLHNPYMRMCIKEKVLCLPSILVCMSLGSLSTSACPRINRWEARDKAEPLWLIGNKDVEKDIAETEKKVAEGYRFFKLKLGVKSLADDILLTNSLHKKFGDTIKLCGDANMGMNLEQASEYVLGVKDSNLSYFEQPLHKTAKDDLKKLIAISPVKIGLDESVTDMSAVLAHVPMGIAGVSLKTLKFGGISGLMAAGHACAALRP
jgi:muconate cycloisomerase